MRAEKLDLGLATSLTYDKNFTSLLNRFKAKTINSKTCYGPYVNHHYDYFTDSGITPGNGSDCSDYNRKIQLSTVSVGLFTIVLYDIDPISRVETYRGRITANIPGATAQTVHSVKFFDNAGSTGWKIYIQTRATTTLINGGLFCINKVDLADFGISSFTNFVMANDLSTTDMKGVYFLQHPSELGVNNLHVTGAGLILRRSENAIYALNGTNASCQIYKYSTTAALSVHAKSTVTLTIASPGKVNYTGHPFVVNDQVVLYTTGALPTGLTASTATTQTVYFVRNPTANDFELSATSGGASINFTGAQSGVHTLMRAFGISLSAHTLKTGTFSGLFGASAFISNNSCYLATPDHGSVLTQGFDCAFIVTSTQAYVGRLDQLTDGGTTWPSLNPVNILGATNEFTTPAAVFAVWMQELQAFCYLTNTAVFVVKKLVNNQIIARFNNLDTQYLEAMPSTIPKFGLTAVISMCYRNGNLFITGNTVGQRVCISLDIYSDENFGFSELITKAIYTKNVNFNFIKAFEELVGKTSEFSYAYRTGLMSSGMFNTKDGSWVSFASKSDLSGITLGEYTQIRVRARILADAGRSPAQLVELIRGFTPPDEISTHWCASAKHSTTDGSTPLFAAFRLQNVYASGTVPALRVDAVDDNDDIVQTKYTVADAAEFTRTSNDGLTWGALGTIPNTALTTEIRVPFTSLPAGKIRFRIIEA